MNDPGFIRPCSGFIRFDHAKGLGEVVLCSVEERGIRKQRVGFGWNSGVLWGFVCVLGGIVVGCKHEPPEAPAEVIVDLGGGGEEPVACDSNTVWFQQQILPILISNCAIPGCHNTATDDNDEIEITSYATLMASGIVQDGDLMEAITETDPDDRMPQPPQAPLEPWQVDLIATWIQQGAQNNSCENAACDTTNVTYSGTIRPLVQLRCQGCHSGATPQGGLNFSAWGPLNMVAMDGRLSGAIQHQPTFTAMPPSGPQLSDCRIAQFLDWVEQGAPNN
ncbi:MAG: hypothetical protein IPL52_00760 [Flavobacteriales bacterium]|nr:hypothetical protein [Flavobacteriales bacterium]